MNEIGIRLTYLLAAVLFIFGLKQMSHPRTAVRGNWLSASGMLIAIAATLIDPGIIRYRWIIVALPIGTVLGAFAAVRVQMTAMPQMVALLNGFGGGASVLVAAAELARYSSFPSDVTLAIALSGLVGAVTFSGSLVAFGKLQEIKWFGQQFPLVGDQRLNAFLGLVLVGLMVGMLQLEGGILPFLLLVVISLALGFLLVMPIGGADMPVVIALLNSYSGIAAAATGFVIDNNVLIIAGSLVGASGIILTQIMCKAMNRSLTHVLFGKLSASAALTSADQVYATVRRTSADDIAMLLDSARRVVIVPGYGMAVAQAQHAVRDLANLLGAKGISVEYAIHPVAGRMPGHMNVLLAEADVPYTQLLEMDAINPTLDTVDVAIVLGANDVVNPLARTDPKSPIAGMPIIDVDKARTVIVVKRSLSPGFAGIPNPLFAAPNTLMFFADGKQGVMEIVSAMKSL